MKGARDPLYSSYIANSVFNAFSAYTAIMLNILTIHAIRKTTSLPKALKTLLLSLAVSDLGVGLLVQPFTVALLVKRSTNDSPSYSTYAAYDFFKGLFSYSSFFGVVAISVDRFLAIHLHLRYQELVTQKRVVAVVISIWIFSAFLSSIIQLMSFVDRKYLAVFFAVIFGLCIVCSGMVYCRIYFTLRRHKFQIRILQLQQATQNLGELANHARVRKSAVSTFYIYLVFLACCLPEYCRLVVSINCKQTITLERFDLYSWTLLFLNSSLNPVIYCWKMRHIRQSIMEILRNILPKQN